MKEVNVFLTNHAQELAELRMSSLEALGSLDAAHVSLTQQIDQVAEAQQTVSPTNTCVKIHNCLFSPKS